MLCVLGIWRHFVRRFPLRYDPSCWAAIFPLGIYSAATWQMAKALGLPFLDALPWTLFLAALAAWALAFVAILFDLSKNFALHSKPEG